MQDNTTIGKSNRADLAFGTQLLGDYARFICDAICYKFESEINGCKKFIETFDGLYAETLHAMTSEELAAINAKVYRDLQAFRKYLLSILQAQIKQEVLIHMNPQTLNMMVNTTELLLDGLAAYMRGEYPDTSTLTTVWLENMTITALDIENHVGNLYFEQKNKARDFAELFLKLHMKSQTLDGMRRTGLKDFPAMNEFYDEIQKAMIGYAEFLVDLIRLIADKKYTGALTLLDVDSTYRRACFFTTKLSQISAIPAPACNPAAGRTELPSPLNE